MKALSRWLERAFTEGGSWSWGDEARPRDFLTLLTPIILAIALLVLLWGAQAKGEAPEYRCNPGDTYTTEECP